MMSINDSRGRITAGWPVPGHFALYSRREGDERFRQAAASVIATAEQLLARGDLFSHTADEIATAHGLERLCILQGMEGSGRLLTLAEAHLLTGEERFATRCVGLLEAYLDLDWFAGEYDLGIAIWFVGVLPAASWLLESPSQAAREGAARLTESLVKRAQECAQKESDFVERGLATQRGPIQNHVFIAACALGQAGLVIGGPEADSHVQRALEVTQNHLFVSDKVGPEGEWFEACPQYQVFLMDHAIVFADACKAAGRADLYRRPRLRVMFESFIDLSCPDGAFVDFNDSTATCGNPLPVLARGASEYRHAGLAWLIERLDGGSSPPWSSTSKQAQFLRYYDPARTPPPAAPERCPDILLRRTGHVVSRSGWEQDAHWFAINGGTVEPHAHIDRGTFTFYYCGRPVMVDTGRGSYVDRYDFILPEKHNVVFAEPGVVFERQGEGWGNTSLPYDAEVWRFLANREMTFAEVDVSGMATCRSGVRRAFFSKTGYLVVIDDLEDDRERTFRAIYHGIGALEQDGTRAVWRQPNGLIAELYLLRPADAEWATGTHPVLGRMGVDEQPYVAIRCRGRRAWYVVLIFPRENAEDGRVEVVENGPRLLLRITRGGVLDRWIIKDDTELIEHGEIETDARVTWVRERGGAIAAWGVVDGWEVRWRGNDLLSGRNSAAVRRTAPSRARTWLREVPERPA